MARRSKKIDHTKLFVQGRLDSELRPDEQPIIDAFRKLTNTVNPDDPDGNKYNIRQAIVKITREWLGLDKKRSDPLQVQLAELRELIIESHQILFDTLSTLNLSDYIDTNTGRSMQDEIGENLQRLNNESLKNVTVDNIVVIDEIDEDEPEGW